MRELYLECYSGISGDMAVAALLDAGADEKYLLESLDSIKLEGYHIEITRVKKSGIDACDFNVVLDKEHENHDHDMKYLHGHTSDNAEEHHHHHHHEGEHTHRGLKEIINIINGANITENAKNLAIKIFKILAEAEAKAHAVDIEDVHFHEVGAVDSIVDIVAFAVCFDNLKIDKVYVPFLYEGRGTIRCQHGIIPVPVPAVSNIVAAHNIVLSQSNVQGELVTPTGAAIVAAVRTDTTLPVKYRIDKIGYGAGKREYEVPSMLRAMLISSEDNISQKDMIYKLETDIDDCSSEILGYTMEKLYKAGAKEVHYMPIYMKKNRPAYELVVICDKDLLETMKNIIFTETTTIGIRYTAMERTVLDRWMEKKKTSFGDEIDVKVCRLPNGETREYPEYESVRELSQKYNIPFIQVIESIKH